MKMKKLDKEQRADLLRILGGAALCGAALCLKAHPAAFWLYLAAYALLGYPVLFGAARNILHGQVFDENLLMGVASLGAMAIGQYSEGVAVMLFYDIGELFQDVAVCRSRRSIAELMKIRPDSANLLRGGEPEKVDPSAVQVGDSILVRPGERVPLDCVVTEGSSSLDTSALTGESLPRSIGPGGELLSGCVNLSGALTARVVKPFGESTASRILDLVENAGSKKSSSEAFITRFARVYTPCVAGAALLLALLPPLLTGQPFSVWIYRALVFLVISCPCALVISVPLAFFGGIGAASRCGVLVKGGNYLETLAAADTVVFDKTGTLTRGVFRVQRVFPAAGFREETLLETAALAESLSTHPIALSLRTAWGGEPDAARVREVRETAGEGVQALVDGVPAAAGNLRLMARLGIAAVPCADPGTVVYVARGGAYAGCVLIADEVKSDAAQAIAALHSVGVRRTVMLTGDAAPIAQDVAARLGIDEAAAGLLPAGKVEKVEALLREEPKGGKLAFVGDGINDAPVLARADIGVAMGAMGSDAAIEAADVVVMTDEPSRIAAAIRIARATRRIARQNIVFALAVKAAVLLLGALGAATMWEAVFADVGVSILAILNSARMLRVRY